MKTRIAFLALIVLLTLTSCGDDFDEDAEKEAVAAVSIGIDDDFANADRESLLAAFHEDFTIFNSYPDDYYTATYLDVSPGFGNAPWKAWWEDYEVLVSHDLAVIKGTRSSENGTAGFGTSVFKKEDGQWKLIHYHGSYAGP